jgi:hypothetical protein
MHKSGPKTTQAGAWQGANLCLTGREIPGARAAAVGKRLVRIDAEEPSDAMMAKINSVVDQTKYSADESI